MRYLPAQAKEAIGISEETFRHWRRALPPLSGKRGYGPCFTPGDLLALKVVAKLHGFGIQVRHLAPHADDKAIVFDGESVELVSVLDSRRLAMRTCMVVPLRSLIAELRQSLSIEERLPVQSDIVFPPVSVSGGRSA